jgi:hypothetical protein
MSSPITLAADHEMQLENQYLAIALTREINQLICYFSFQNFANWWLSNPALWGLVASNKVHQVHKETKSEKNRTRAIFLTNHFERT